MIKYAITGNIASGKTTVEEFFNKNGYEILDTDKIAHKILDTNALEQVVKEFGKEILSDSKIDRIKLGQIVFSNLEKRKTLENIIHPLVKKEILKYFEEKKNEKEVFVAVPLLFEAGMSDMFDKIILVVADDETRLERLVEKRGLTRNDALKRIKSQMSQFAKFEDSDYVFHNNAELENLENQVKNFCDKILKEQK